MPEEDEKKKEAPPDSGTTSEPSSAVNAAPSAAIPTPQFLGFPPGQPGPLGPNVLLQMGVGLPQQQNPEVVKYLTDFFKHDSDNRLKVMDGAGRRNHTFRMNALYIGTGLALLFFAVPLGVELYRGDMVFVRDFVEKYLPVAAMIILALFAGPKLAEIFKG